MTANRGNWLLTALLALGLGPLGAHAAEAGAVRTVAVTGQGEVSAEPDMARVTLGVTSRKPTLAAARTEVTGAVDRVLALTRSLRIDPGKVNATRVQVQPEYSWNEKDRKQTLLGYVVSRQIEVEVTDLEQLGPLLERAVDAGANTVSDPQLDSSRRKALEREAMALAVKDAQASAQVLATAAGARLGPVKSLNAASVGQPMPLYRVAMAAAPPTPENAAATYQAAAMKFSSTVSAEFDLLVGP